MPQARRLSASFTAVGLALCSAAAATAGPALLTDGQLDAIAAGSATTVGASSDAGATGLVTLTGTATNSIVVGSASQFPGQPGIGPTGGASEGTALAVGTNFGHDDLPPAQTATAVQTGAATAYPVAGASVNYTVHGAGGVQLQVGWTFVQGGWNGL